jgi:hypothetical protein
MAPVHYPALRRLLDQGAQLVEVLPAQEYTEIHLPGAVNIPLKTLTATTIGPAWPVPRTASRWSRPPRARCSASRLDGIRAV